MNLIEVTKAFRTKQACLDYLASLRWPNGVICQNPNGCGIIGDEHFRKFTTNETERKRFSKKQNAWVVVKVPSRSLYECKECGYQFTATTGTVFHDTHLPLDKWFMAIALILEGKKGMSALQIGRHVGINKRSYRTMWHLCHRIREGMKDDGAQLKGKVEVDETYVGGKIVRRADRNKPRKEKDIVLGMVERGGRLRLMPLADMKAKIVGPVLEQNIAPDVKTVYTDEHVTYYHAVGRGAFIRKHKTVNHSKNYGIGSTHTNTIENAFSLFKRGLIGSYHKVSIKHLGRYCDEFSYRFNRRDEQHWMFEDTVRNLLTGKALTLKTLTASETSEPSSRDGQ